MIEGTTLEAPIEMDNLNDCHYECKVRNKGICVRFTYYLNHCILFGSYTDSINYQGCISGKFFFL